MKSEINIGRKEVATIFATAAALAGAVAVSRNNYDSSHQASRILQIDPHTTPAGVPGLARGSGGDGVEAVKPKVETGKDTHPNPGPVPLAHGVEQPAGQISPDTVPTPEGENPLSRPSFAEPMGGIGLGDTQRPEAGSVGFFGPHQDQG